MDQRAVREAVYHDHRFSDPSVRSGAGRFYRIASTIQGRYRVLILDAAPQGLRALEYGCGTGSSAFELASAGASVCGIDISRAAIATAASVQQSLDSWQPQFMVMNAESLGFSNQSFDLVCGTGILHHLELGAACGEIARVLRRDGMAVFVEPLAACRRETTSP